MSLTRPAPLPFDPYAWEKRPFWERARMACQAWALQGYAAPALAYAFYALKLGVYIGGFLLFCSLTPGLGGPAEWPRFWLNPLAFQKAVLWSMLFEGLGLGCGSGPLTGRYAPPIAGVLHFARPGTTKLPLFPRLPLLSGIRRSLLDVALYLALVCSLVRALVAPSLGFAELAPIAVLLPVLGIFDKTLFLIFRSEHYWLTVLCFVCAGNWIAGAKAVQLALWFWAGFSKLNHHFPATVCVMTSNSPVTRFAWLRRLMYRRYPNDLRPSRLAVLAAHSGIAFELGVPLVLLLSPGGKSLAFGLVAMLLLHGFITSNIPMGVPIEWNFMVVYGGFALFWARPDVTIWQLGNPLLALFLIFALLAVPLLGNLFPARVSFLLAMRYYAGNWPCSVWLFRGDSQKKLARLRKCSAGLAEQIARFYGPEIVIAVRARLLAFRLMHLHGRALQQLLPQAVNRLDDYEYVEGEVIAGLALGWNFGDGHLHHEQLLAAIQAQCQFEAGELRCVFMEGQPFGRGSLAYRIVDAVSGELTRGELAVARLREVQPWPASEPGALGPVACDELSEPAH
jgi:hypothetical protein